MNFLMENPSQNIISETFEVDFLQIIIDSNKYPTLVFYKLKIFIYLKSPSQRKIFESRF